MNVIKRIISLLIILIISGCTSTPYYRSYINPTKKDYKIKKIAILPFSAPNGQLNVEKYITDLLAFKLLTSGFTIVNKEEADAVIEGSIGEYGYKQEAIENINIFIGTSTYETKSLEGLIKTQPKPVCTLTIKLIETSSGTILWMSSFISDPSFTTMAEALEEITERISKEITGIFK